MSVRERKSIESELDEIKGLIAQRTGLSFARGRNPNAELEIRRAMEREAVAHPAEYQHRLASERGLLDELVEDLTVGESYFFREPEQLEFIRKEVLPETTRRDMISMPVRAWSAGCASGEEAYTIAILLEEAGANGASVVGTDISRSRLARAARARYTRWSLRGVPDVMIRRYFQQRGKFFDLAPEIRTNVEFRYLNLAAEEYPSLRSGIWGMDLILCRNVLIYLDEPTIAAVASRLMESLGENGWLFLGASDPSLAGLVPCEVVTTGAGVAYRKRSGRRTGARVAPSPSRRRTTGSQTIRKQPPAPVAPPATKSQPDARVEPETRGRSAPRSSLQHYRERDYAAAARTARSEIQRGDAEPERWVVLVRALANQGLLADARSECLQALARHPASAELLYLHSILLGADDLHEEAVAAARRAVYADRSLVMGHLALGSSLARLGHRAAALRSLRNAQRLLAAMPPQDIVPAADGELARTVGERVRSQLRLLQETA